MDNIKQWNFLLFWKDSKFRKSSLWDQSLARSVSYQSLLSWKMLCPSGQDNNLKRPTVFPNQTAALSNKLWSVLDDYKTALAKAHFCCCISCVCYVVTWDDEPSAPCVKHFPPSWTCPDSEDTQPWSKAGNLVHSTCFKLENYICWNKKIFATTRPLLKNSCSEAPDQASLQREGGELL